MAKQKKTSKHGKNAKSSGKTTSNKSEKRKKSKAAKNGFKELNGNDDAFRQQITSGSRTIHEMEADGNCLFRSLSDQIHYDHGERHEIVRSEICDYLEKNEDFFKGFVVLDDDDDNTADSDEVDVSSFEDYVKCMREDGEWGGNPELVCAARLYRHNITVFTAQQAFSIDCGSEKTKGPDLMLSYHDNDHYNSVHNIQPDSENDLEASSRCNGDMPVDQSKPKRNEPCYCGSGKKFKNCCLNGQRPKLDRKVKNKHKRGDASTNDSTKKQSQVNVLEGDFKVLKI